MQCELVPGTATCSQAHCSRLQSTPQFPAALGALGCGLGSLVPGLGEGGRDLLRLMLIYDPDHRAHARRLLRHSYFAELR